VTCLWASPSRLAKTGRVVVKVVVLVTTVVLCRIRLETYNKSKSEIILVVDLRGCWRNCDQHEAGAIGLAYRDGRHFAWPSASHCSGTIIGIAFVAIEDAGENTLGETQG